MKVNLIWMIYSHLFDDGQICIISFYGLISSLFVNTLMKNINIMNRQ